MADVTIRKIPAHVVYTAEYDVNSFMDFFDPETDTEANMVFKRADAEMYAAKEKMKAVR